MDDVADLERLHALATDPGRQRELFGRDGLLPLWIAEPYVALSEDLHAAMVERARRGWYGYEVRPPSAQDAFWGWMGRRHGWDGSGLHTTISPSVGTSIGVLMDQLTSTGDGVILQPPVFTDFKPLVVRAERRVVRNPLVLTDQGYHMDLDDLASKAAEPSTTMMILCNPHNPVGRVWSRGELAAVADICHANGVAVVADEIHADLVLSTRRFTPFAAAASATGVRWAATHGPIKTFGLAGVCDTLVVTDDDRITDGFRSVSSRLHLTRNNVFGVAAFETAYRDGESWLDDLLAQIRRTVSSLTEALPDPIRLVEPEATYLAWLDFRDLGLDVPALAEWLVDAGLALSPGHWFGREGAGFARMTIAAPPAIIAEAVRRLDAAVPGLPVA